MKALRLAIVCALFAALIGCGNNQGAGGDGGAGEGGHGGHGGGMESTSSTGGGGSPSTSSTSSTTTSSTGTQMGCSHDACSVGPALTASCDACTADVCGGDPACCEAYWDATCVAEAGFVCQQCQGPCSPTTCADGCCDSMSGNCSHNGCEFYGVPCGGDHPDGMTSTCAECGQGGCETCDATSCHACVPDCAGKACGDPDGCGSRCDGACGSGEFCSIALGKCSNHCDASTCPNGCCDGSGACRGGIDDAACGANGQHCQACSGHACIALDAENAPAPGGACRACDSTTCKHGCCTSDGHCEVTSDAACGNAGATCVDCTLQGSVCQYQESCAECTADCAGKACGDSDGCGGTCDGPCAAGTYCIHGMPSHADGCVTCGPDTCDGCCDASGQCQPGQHRTACGSSGAACADCGAQACDGVFQGDQYVNQCGACGQNCFPPIPGEPVPCVDDGCGNLCPGASCPTSFPGEPAMTCTLGASGTASCQAQGFCYSGTCDGCCDTHGNCVAGNLPSACGSGANCVDCVAKGETCDPSALRCQGCTPSCAQATSCGQQDGCGGVCNGAEGGTCVAGASCDDHATCHCDGAHQALCYDAQFQQHCLDVGSDPDNCGGCGRICPTGVACVDGACACPTGNHYCAGQSGEAGVCTNLGTDPNHCGSCYGACPGTACVHGACAPCPSGTTSCGNGCVDLQTSAVDCGVCGNVCPTGIACTNGICDCGGGEIGCAGTCIDPTSDPANCGACSKACPQGVSCQSGQCVCPGNATLCGSMCTNLDLDPANCGHCGVTCNGGTCIGGTCH